MFLNIDSIQYFGIWGAIGHYNKIRCYTQANNLDYIHTFQCADVFVLCYPHSSTLPEEHSSAALPLRSARPHLCPLCLSGLELHSGSLLVLQVQSPVEPVCLWGWTLVGTRTTQNRFPTHIYVTTNPSPGSASQRLVEKDSSSGWLSVNLDSG